MYSDLQICFLPVFALFFSIGIILFTSSGKNNQQLGGIFCFRFLYRITIYFPSFSF